jgi:uncharacterized damage-inducible protein DinB
MTNRNVDDQGRPEPPVSSDEVSTLLGFLEFQRATLEWKCRKLSSTDLQNKTAASSMTLGGILKHMAYVENHWFSDWLIGRDKLSPWREVDWSQDRDWDWNSAANDSPEQLLKLWHDACELSRLDVASTLKNADLGQLAKRTWPNGDSPSLRWILVHMIEEYARHNGHADLLREAIDGQVGE